ncbi:MAG: 3-hydroxyacyl-[acyl-carrier-protein] dehydratase FabA, partial [Polyangiaceae bacterium]
EPPLLLADRMTGLDAEPTSMGLGTIWTETDVHDDSWYLHHGRMPAGVMIESGQADLMLISYLGIDLLNKSDRVYRLLGCELTYHGPLPKPGDTLCYDIHVDGHASQGDARLFFFHYDCRVDGELKLSVRGGQAGFFSDEELADSAGVLWDAETAEPCDHPRLDQGPQLSERRRFSSEQLRAFAAGKVDACFGPGFEFASTHTRTPTIADGRMLWLDEVTDFDPAGGPWGRGYLRATDTIEPDDWFFDGHFNNDPCMPGTLMFEGCLQAMAIYMSALGFTIERDGWRFEPVHGDPYAMRCRGQVLPSSKDLVYEIFIEEVVDGPTPMIYADLLCTIDGLKAFHCRRMGLRLVPDWPLDDQLKKLPELAIEAPGPVATVDGFAFGYDSLLACAWGKPSRAFGPIYSVFDNERRVARLPGPPYHFMSRIEAIDGEIGVMRPDQRVQVAYDVPEDAWYFSHNGAPTMPYCVLLEAALQPCGWLASFVGSALGTESDLCFRNLDGTATQHVEVLPDSGTFRTKVRLTNVSATAGMIIESFEVECHVDDVLVYDMKTVFGFFPPEAFVDQTGLPIPKDEQGALDEDWETAIDLSSRPDAYFAGDARLPSPKLTVIDRVTGIWPEGGAAGLGRYRAEKDVSADEWFFKAHFFQDPVQPGSLGIEAMIQLLQFAMLERGMGASGGRFEPLALGKAMTWKYRGQVTPKNDVITTLIDITESGEDERGPYLVASASLWVDGKRIYEATNLAMRIVTDAQADTLDPEHDTWLRDHCPTFTVPALPMMSMVDRMAGAAPTAAGEHVVGIDRVEVKRWLPLPGPVRTRCEVTGKGPHDVTLLAWREAPRAELSRFEPVATAQITVADAYPTAPA